MSAVVVLDVESTGKERETDQVIELCIRLGLGAEAAAHTWRIKPTVSIHPEATGVHGITAEAVAACPPFGDVVPEFRPLIDAADVVVGYNVAFDLDMIQAELIRAKAPPLDLAGKQVVDVLRLWHHVEPRTLVAAHEKFCGEPIVDAHHADADVAATGRVLTAMLQKFGLTDKSWPEVAAISNPFKDREAWVGPSRHLQWDARGAVVFTFGKYKGSRIDQVDGGFLRWVMGKDFPQHVKDICHAALTRRHQFGEWIAQHYPRQTSLPLEGAP